jgi:hypothetical protein
LFRTLLTVPTDTPASRATAAIVGGRVRPPEATGATARRLEKLMTPASVAARRILDAVERDAYRVTVGRDAAVMDLLARLAPERAARLVRTRMQALLG